MMSVHGPRDPDGMSETIFRPASPNRLFSQRAFSQRYPGQRDSARLSIGALRAVPVIGGALTVANAIVAIGVAGVVMALLLGFDSNPHTPANAYLGAHYTDAYPASHPLLLEVWGA